jgi:sugar phosphate permease
MGLGEGILFPCMHQIAGAWYPLQERSRLVSLVASGSDLGTITALIVSPAILEASNWQRIFVVFGVLSFLWVVVYLFVGVSRPEEDPHITPAEREYIVRNRTIDPVTHSRQSNLAELDTHKMNWRVLLTSRPAWAIYVAHICYNYSWYVLLGWIPQYFHDHLHIDLGKHGIAAALPYACGYVGTLLFGRIGDHLVAKNYRELHVRRLMNGIGFLGSAFFLYSLRFARTAPEAVALLSLTLFTSRATMAGYWVNMIDIGPNHAAHIMGVSNTFATIPGIIGNIVTGKILEATGGWDLVFAIAALVLVFGAVFFHCNASDKSIYDSRYASDSGYLSTASTRSTSSPEYGLPVARDERRDDEVGLLEDQ